MNIVIPDVLKSFGFDNKLLLPIVRQKVLAEAILQKSLDAYAADIQFGKIIEKRKILSPLRYFLAITHKGLIYASDMIEVSEEEKALSDHLKSKKQEIERIELKKNELKEVEFQLWVEQLSEDEKKSPKFFNGCFNYMDDFHLAAMRGYFEENIYSFVINS